MLLLILQRARGRLLALATLLTVAGMIDCQVIAVVHARPGSAGCSPGSGCERILGSAWSHPGGLPLYALAYLALGLLLGLLAGGALAVPERRRPWVIAIALLTSALVASATVLAVVAHHLQAVCPYCRVLDVLILLQALVILAWLAALVLPAAAPGRTGPTGGRFEDPSRAATVLVRPGASPLQVAADHHASAARAALAEHRPARALMPWILSLVGSLTLAGLYGDGLLEAAAARVVARQQGLTIHQGDLERMLAGSASADELLRQRIAQRLLERRLDLDLFAAEAERRHLDLAAYLASLAPAASAVPAATTAGADEARRSAVLAELARLRAASAPGAGAPRIDLPTRPPLLSDADWQLAYDSGPADAPVGLALVVDPSCGVCTTEVRDLAWALRQEPRPVRLSLLVRAGAGDASAGAVAAGLAAAAEQGRAWELLVALASQGDERTWSAAALAARVPDLGLGLGLDVARWSAGLVLPANLQRIAEQQRVIAALVGGSPLPRLYLDHQELGGYAPRELLAGLLAAAAATALPEDLLPDLGLPDGPPGAAPAPGAR